MPDAPRAMRPEEKEKVARTLCEAAFDDPLVAYVLPSEGARRRWLPYGVEMFLAAESQAGIQVLEDCAAVLCAYPPGSVFGGSVGEFAERAKAPTEAGGAGFVSAAAGLMAQLGAAAPPDSGAGRLLGSLLGLASSDALPVGALLRLSGLFSAMEKRAIAAPHYRVSFLAVRPDRRRRGLARRLLSPVFEAADKERVPCYGDLCSPDGRLAAERLGFRASEEFRPLPDGPLMWRLVREPAR